MERVRGITKQLEGITTKRVLELFEESKKITKSSCKEIVLYVEAFQDEFEKSTKRELKEM